ncbi:MAG TPA: type II toxin-antitoxin system prevent-host-death family antitoxin [Terriglobales bacterium]|nr:type II toxin-antitoxin system prevent-host-death family antitoxin [Terriglobales bacterium]
MEYTVHEAKTNLSRLLQEASEGKEVIIARGKKPVARLVAIGAASKKRMPGKFKGQISYAEDAFDPLTDRELDELGFE